MRTRVAVDAALVEEVKRLGGHKTKTAATEAALQEYIQHHGQARIFELSGTIDYDPAYHYKAARRRKRR